MKYFLISTVVLLTLTQKSNDNLINWNERKLKWSDFQGYPSELKVSHEGKYSGAATYSSVYMETQGWIGDSVIFFVPCFFDKNKSWKREFINSDYQLNHEQRHFDITEYVARGFRESLQTFTFSDIELFNNETDSIFNSWDLMSDSLQDSYDRDTRHSLDTNFQIKWDKKIDSLLNSKKDFSRDRFKVDLSYLY